MIVSRGLTRPIYAAFALPASRGLLSNLVHPGLPVTDPDNPDSRFVVLLKWTDGRIVGIRDFFFARHVMDGIAIARI